MWLLRRVTSYISAFRVYCTVLTWEVQFPGSLLNSLYMMFRSVRHATQWGNGSAYLVGQPYEHTFLLTKCAARNRRLNSDYKGKDNIRYSSFLFYTAITYSTHYKNMVMITKQPEMEKQNNVTTHFAVLCSVLNVYSWNGNTGTVQYVGFTTRLCPLDQISIEELDIIYKIPHCVPISAHHKWNFDDLLEKMWEYLKLVRMYVSVFAFNRYAVLMG